MSLSLFNSMIISFKRYLNIFLNVKIILKQNDILFNKYRYKKNMYHNSTDNRNNPKSTKDVDYDSSWSQAYFENRKQYYLNVVNSFKISNDTAIISSNQYFNLIKDTIKDNIQNMFDLDSYKFQKIGQFFFYYKLLKTGRNFEIKNFYEENNFNNFIIFLTKKLNDNTIIDDFCIFEFDNKLILKNFCILRKDTTNNFLFGIHEECNYNIRQITTKIGFFEIITRNKEEKSFLNSASITTTKTEPDIDMYFFYKQIKEKRSKNNEFYEKIKTNNKIISFNVPRKNEKGKSSSVLLEKSEQLVRKMEYSTLLPKITHSSNVSTSNNNLKTMRGRLEKLKKPLKVQIQEHTQFQLHILRHIQKLHIKIDTWYESIGKTTSRSDTTSSTASTSSTTSSGKNNNNYYNTKKEKFDKKTSEFAKERWENLELSELEEIMFRLDEIEKNFDFFVDITTKEKIYKDINETYQRCMRQKKIWDETFNKMSTLNPEKYTRRNKEIKERLEKYCLPFVNKIIEDYKVYTDELKSFTKNVPDSLLHTDEIKKIENKVKGIKINEMDKEINDTIIFKENRKTELENIKEIIVLIGKKKTAEEEVSKNPILKARKQPNIQKTEKEIKKEILALYNSRRNNKEKNNLTLGEYSASSSLDNSRKNNTKSKNIVELVVSGKFRRKDEKEQTNYCYKWVLSEISKMDENEIELKIKKEEEGLLKFSQYLKDIQELKQKEDLGDVTYDDINIISNKLDIDNQKNEKKEMFQNFNGRVHEFKQTSNKYTKALQEYTKTLTELSKVNKSFSEKKNLSPILSYNYFLIINVFDPFNEEYIIAMITNNFGKITLEKIENILTEIDKLLPELDKFKNMLGLE